MIKFLVLYNFILLIVFLYTFAWNRWDYSNPGYLDALKHLTDLKEEGYYYLFTFPLCHGHLNLLFLNWLDYFSEGCTGKIKTVALTNFDTERLRIILENGIPVVSNQVFLIKFILNNNLVFFPLVLCSIDGENLYYVDIRCNIQLLICVLNREWRSSVSLQESNL